MGLFDVFSSFLTGSAGNLESSDNYNIIAGNQKGALTTMTVKEVREFQKDLERKNAKSTALGRYQIKDETLDYLIKRMNLKGNEIFDEKMQDRMGRELLRKRGIEDFKNGKFTEDEFILFLSKEWASLPKDKSNKSYHDGTGNNKALTDYNTMKDLLKKE